MVNIIRHPIKWAEECMKRFKWYDVKLAQIITLFAVLTAITLWPKLLELIQKLDWYWYLIITLVLAIPLLKRMFFEK